MFRIVKILFFVAWSTPSLAQIPAEEVVDYIYRSHWSVGPKLSTNGFGGEFNYERRATDRLRHSFHLSFNHIKAHKETKKSNPFYDDSKSYVFGKTNQFYTAHLSYGGSWRLYDKKRKSGVSIRFNQQFGLSSGLVKPIYLKIKEPFLQDLNVKPTDERYDPTIHPEEKIYGKSNEYRGLSESLWTFGLYIKSGFQFDFSSNKDRIFAVEIGAQIELYKKDIPMFYIGENKSIYPSLFAVVQLGKNRI